MHNTIAEKVYYMQRKIILKRGTHHFLTGLKKDDKQCVSRSKKNNYFDYFENIVENGAYINLHLITCGVVRLAPACILCESQTGTWVGKPEPIPQCKINPF